MAFIQSVFQLHRFGDKFVFGKKGNHQMLWRNEKDLQEFKQVTTKNNFEKHILIMGSNTFKSLKSKLPNRLNYVLSSKDKNIFAQNKDTPDLIIHSLEEFKEQMLNLPEESLVSIIGGFSLIKELILNQHICSEEHHDHNETDYEVQELYITIFENEFNTTGELITVEQFELQELVKDYQLLEIKNIDDNINLYHYIKRDV